MALGWFVSQQRLNDIEIDTYKWAVFIEKSNIRVKSFWTGQWIEDGKWRGNCYQSLIKW